MIANTKSEKVGIKRIMKFRSSIFKNMRQYRLWSLMFIFSRQNMLMVKTSLEDTPCPIPATEARQKLKKLYPKAEDNTVDILTLSAADMKQVRPEGHCNITQPK